ncbi:MAG: hypothetical protein ACRC46_09270 [Thermoguttaceae bacterium]
MIDPLLPRHNVTQYQSFAVCVQETAATDMPYRMAIPAPITGH